MKVYFLQVIFLGITEKVNFLNYQMCMISFQALSVRHPKTECKDHA